MRKSCATIASALVLLFVLAISATATPVELKFAGQAAPTHPTTKMMYAIANDIEKETQGRYKIKVYPANQLGGLQTVYQEMMRGTIDMFIGGIAADYDPRLAVIYTCGYTPDYEITKKVFEPDSWLVKKLNEISLGLGVRILAPYLEGMQGIGSIRPVTEPLNPNTDKGVLLRVATYQTYQLGGIAMGYRTVTIPWSDIYQAMQTKMCDAVFAVPPMAGYLQLGDLITDWYVINYSPEMIPFMMSEKTFSKLSPQDQKIFQEVFTKYGELSIDAAKKMDYEAYDLMKKKGIRVHTYTDKELEPIFKALRGTWDKLGEDTLGKDLMQEFREYIETVVPTESKR